jgi:hypothetical protein
MSVQTARKIVEHFVIRQGGTGPSQKACPRATRFKGCEPGGIVGPQDPAEVLEAQALLKASTRRPFFRDPSSAEFSHLTSSTRLRAHTLEQPAREEPLSAGRRVSAARS